MTLLLALTVLLAAPGPEILPAAPPSAEADLILTGGHVITMLEPEPRPAPTAIACRGDRILWLGSDAEVAELRGEDTEIVALDGAVVIPGFVDGHAHLTGLGKALAEIDLRHAPSAAACVEKVVAAAGEIPTHWLQGRGWDQTTWPGGAWPHRRLLDEALPGRPVLLRRVDGHAAWASSEALRLAGITATTPDPEGGSIHRDEQGEATGVLLDNAVDLVRDVIPEAVAAEWERRVRVAQQHCLAHGLVGVHEMGVRWPRVELYRDLAASGELELRLSVFLSDDPATLEAGFAAGPYVSDDLMLQVRSIKLYADGALGSRGALLLDEYSDASGERGLQVSSTAHLRAVAGRARAAGWQVGAHAIGDAANRLLLDLFAEILGPAGDPAARWRIEHAQIVAPVDLPRFAELGVIAAMQPVHCTSDMDWVPDRLGDQRLQGAYAWRSLLDTGAAICFGTDFPVEDVDPLAGLYAARTRSHPDGTPIGGWLPEERLDARTALRLYTLGSAYAAFLEDESGVLAPGRLADLTVLSGDPTVGEPDALLAIEPRLTVVGGRVRWRSGN